MKIRVTCQACRRKRAVTVAQGVQVQAVYLGDGLGIAMDNAVEATEDVQCRCGSNIATNGELIFLVAPGRRFQAEWSRAAFA